MAGQARPERLRQAERSGAYQYSEDAVEQAGLGMLEAGTGGSGGGGARAATEGHHKSPAAREGAAQQPLRRGGGRRPQRRATPAPRRRPEWRRPGRRADHGAATAPGHLPSLALSSSAATDGTRPKRTNRSLQEVREGTVKTYLEHAPPQLERKAGAAPASRHLVRRVAPQNRRRLPPARLLTSTAISVPLALDKMSPLHDHVRSLVATTVPNTVRGVTGKTARGDRPYRRPQYPPRSSTSQVVRRRIG